MSYHTKSLALLEINPSDLTNLSATKIKALFRKKYLEQAKATHPDRNQSPGAPAAFRAVHRAYERLLNGPHDDTDISTNADDRHDIDADEIYNYFTATQVTIPKTAFDKHLRDGVQNVYEQLITTFSALQHEEEKRAFASYYAPFLNLKTSLDRNMAEMLYQQELFFSERWEETFTQLITREWRALTLKTYGEEFLNDFVYRNALATGNLFPILATRKLLSPIKALSFLVHSLLLLPSSALTYYTSELLKHLIYEAFSLRRDDIKKITLFALKIAIILAVVGVGAAKFLTFEFLPLAVTAIIFALPLIYRTLSLLSSPVNQLFRPLGQYFHLSPAWFSALSAVALTALVCGLIALTAFTGSLGLLSVITIALTVCNLIAATKLIYDTCKKVWTDPDNSTSPTPSIILALSTFIAPFSLALPGGSAISQFFESLINSGVLYLNMRKGEYSTQEEKEELLATLPLPQENIPEGLEAATLLGYTNASTRSNRFFNTPKEAECLPAKGRSAWQQTCCFFGIEPDTKKRKINFTRSPQPILALTDEMEAPILAAAS